MQAIGLGNNLFQSISKIYCIFDFLFIIHHVELKSVSTSPTNFLFYCYISLLVASISFLYKTKHHLIIIHIFCCLICHLCQSSFIVSNIALCFFLVYQTFMPVAVYKHIKVNICQIRHIFCSQLSTCHITVITTLCHYKCRS